MNMTVDSRISATTDVACPVCESPSSHSADAPGWGEWRRCSACTLEFANPLRLGHDPTELFNAAYQGKVETSAMDDFYRRVAQRHVIIDQLNNPALWFWTPAFQHVLTWLNQRLGSGKTVLELGCGLGFFLHALRNQGFHAVGLDVAETVVELNRRDGFEIWHGPVESMPIGRFHPDAVVSFFMLHHLDNPMAFLRAVRERAEDAPLAIAVYGPSNTGTAASTPPRTLIRWNARALATALRRTGYQVEVHEVASTGVEQRLLQPLRGVLARTMRLPLVYQLGKRIEARVLPKFPSKAKRNAYVVLAFADPVSGAASQ